MVDQMKKIRVALIHNIIAPYRQPLFQHLSDHELIDLTVYFCSKSHKNRKWDVKISDSYKNEIMNGFTISFNDNEFTYHLNPSIVHILTREKYDVVIIGGATDFTTELAFFTSKILKIPVILWSEGFEGTQSILGKIISPISNYIIKKADAIIVPGIMARDYHIKIGASQNKVFLAPNIVDNHYFIENSELYRKKKNEIKKDLQMDNKKIILFVGQLIERKGVEYLIDAFQMLKKDMNDILLVIVGDGPLNNKLKEICFEKNIDNDVIFTGWLSDKKIVYYSIADVFVLPSLEDLCPLVINEAMSCALPVITTKMVGCSFDMIKNGENGFIINIKDSYSLYESLNRILRNDFSAMGEYSMNIIKNNFMIENSVEGFVDAINYVIRK